MNLQVQRLQEFESGLLPVRQVPWVLEPDVTGAGQDVLVFLLLLGDFLSPYFVHGIGELPNNVKLVEHQSRLRNLGLDRLDVGGPHVAADAVELGGPLWPEESKKRGDGVFGPPFTAPDEASGLQVIDVVVKLKRTVR